MVEEIADVVERRLSRHFDVKRVADAEGLGPVRVWALTERSASPRARPARHLSPEGAGPASGSAA